MTVTQGPTSGQVMQVPACGLVTQEQPVALQVPVLISVLYSVQVQSESVQVQP